MPRIIGQLPGCLPRGFTLDSLLTVQQFAVWRQKSVDAVKAELRLLKKCVFQQSQKDRRIHPRSFLEFNLD